MLEKEDIEESLYICKSYLGTKTYLKCDKLAIGQEDILLLIRDTNWGQVTEYEDYLVGDLLARRKYYI